MLCEESVVISPVYKEYSFHAVRTLFFPHSLTVFVEGCFRQKIPCRRYCAPNQNNTIA